VRRAYTLLLHLLLPAILARLAWRARRQLAYLEDVGERFGRYPNVPNVPNGTDGPDRPVIWLHAVSVGETRAAQPLVRALIDRHPDHRVLLTQMTPTGRETARELFGAGVLRAYLPYDYPWAIAAFLRRFRPRVGVLMETELWPNLIAGCRAGGVPLLLVNARLSEKSARGYARVGGLARTGLGALAGIAAQTEADAARLAALGAGRVEVLGNLKFDVAPPPAQIALGARMRGWCGGRPVLLAASTREGEEALILDAWRASAPEQALLLLVPRHPQRFDEVARLVETRGLQLARRSADAPPGPGLRVLLGDSLGEMFAYLAACDVAFIGGSLLPLGGQNLIEACAVGRPVIVGPHTFNFAQATEQAIEAGAALRVDDAAAMLREAARLLHDPAARESMSAAGRAFAQRHRGATEKTVALIERHLRN
jgi:3-deoxy-D-manno-octulosonic-acid transferase